MIRIRSHTGTRTKLCSKCNEIKERASKRYCNTCANAYQREWRKSHPMNEFQRAKANTRSKTKIYVKRGKIEKLPCCICQATENIEAHHHDYNDFKNVEWMCRSCHRDHHVEQTYDQWKWKQLNFWSIKI